MHTRHGEISLLETVVDLNPARYLAANPDVASAGLDAEGHFERHGRQEGRKQLADPARVQAVRDAKLSHVAFNRPHERIHRGAMDFIPAEVRESFGIPDDPPVAQNDYAAEIIEEIRAHPDDLFLDVGAGFRHVYYPNVVNAEIWAAPSTDVVCIGEDLPFADAQFDHVLCLAVLEHTKRPWIAAQEILRVLKPGGTVRIDWPFLQPVHGYPHHYYNATPTGTVSMFADACDIISADVRPWQHPIFSLHWMAAEWAGGLAGEAREAFGRMTIDELLQGNRELFLHEPFCRELTQDAQKIIAAGTTLLARKR